MSKPVIILGAGASFDYVHSPFNRKDNAWKPPLTNELFGRNVFDEFLDKYPEVKLLASDAVTKVPDRMTLEMYLTEIKEKKADKDENRQRQLVALGFYLQQLFQRVSQHYGNQPLNNYRSLIEKIKDNGGEATIVNFNYDKLLEQNVPNIKDRINHYIEGPIKIIKIHGACDWVYLLDNMFNVDETYNFFMQNPRFSSSTNIKPPKLSEVSRELSFDSYKQNYNGQLINFYPAVAIPITKDKFICPDSHIGYLKKALAETNKILIIGWSAGDPQLLNLIKENVKQTVYVTIVAEGYDIAVEIGKKIKNSNLLQLKPSKQNGFSSFMRSEEIDQFLEI